MFNFIKRHRPRRINIEGIKFPVIELFQSIQGEGFWMGASANFIRFAGCNLRCSWCDTKSSWDNKDVKWMTAAEIVDCLDPASIVVLTGGEPCMQKNLIHLCHALQEVNLYVCIETNGTLPVPTNIDWVTVSPKPDANYTIHPKCNPSEIKFVVSEEFHFDTVALPWLQLYEKEPVLIWLQPEGFNMDKSAAKAHEMVLDNSSYGNLRLGIQMHKIFKVQ